MDELKEFLIKNRMSFEQLLRAYNFWVSLTPEEKGEYISAYQSGEIKTEF